MPHIGVQFLCVVPAAAVYGLNGVHNGCATNQLNSTYLTIGLRRGSDLTEAYNILIFHSKSLPQKLNK
jgi:hypothetical protein